MKKTEQPIGELKKGDVALIIREDGTIELAFPSYEEDESVGTSVLCMCAIAAALSGGWEALDPIFARFKEELDALD